MRVRFLRTSLVLALTIATISFASAANSGAPSSALPPMEMVPQATPSEPPRYRVRTPPSRPAPTRNVYEIISDSKTLTKFAGFIESSGQKALFTTKPDQPITVFVPADSAFDDASKDTMHKIENNLPSFVQYHVVNNTLVVSSAIKGRKLTSTSANGESIQFDGTDKTQAPKVNDGIIVGEDIPATNGVIHVVSTVLAPPSMGEVAAAAPAVKTPPSPPPEPIKIAPGVVKAPTAPTAPVAPATPVVAAPTQVAPSIPAASSATTAAEPATATTTGLAPTTTETAPVPSAETQSVAPAEAVPAAPTETPVPPPSTPEKKGGFELFGHKFGW